MPDHSRRGRKSETELTFAGLHQFCAPYLDRPERFPHPQRDARGTVFGPWRGDAPDRFLVGLAVLSLMAEWPRSSRRPASSTKRSSSTAFRLKFWGSSPWKSHSVKTAVTASATSRRRAVSASGRPQPLTTEILPIPFLPADR
jgi:hypothetical protein